MIYSSFEKDLIIARAANYVAATQCATVIDDESPHVDTDEYCASLNSMHGLSVNSVIKSFSGGLKEKIAEQEQQLQAKEYIQASNVFLELFDQFVKAKLSSSILYQIEQPDKLLLDLYQSYKRILRIPKQLIDSETSQQVDVYNLRRHLRTVDQLSVPNDDVQNYFDLPADSSFSKIMSQAISQIENKLFLRSLN
ncbi:MAG: hypothetical protein H6626_06915 [Pseudobdellovibrionaceae bacterium]|nr:hypothetical protein [Bdellovibrionales bacterium]USN48814.1 MAG: hypothetical protein H6626_06915 [Pseudobdellovibrionaceae bacterium]